MLSKYKLFRKVLQCKHILLIFLKGIENAEFHCGKAEQVLPSLIKRLRGTEVVAVVDPPRNGLRTELFAKYVKHNNLHPPMKYG